MMSVKDAVLGRRSVRQFLSTPVSESLVLEMLKVANQAPSGGNVQPWKVHVVFGEARDGLVEYINNQELSGPEYDIYPVDLEPNYKKRREKIGNDMYALLGVPKSDRGAKLKHVARNYCFFDAPVGIFFTLKKYMGPPQWSDVGMFMQNLMLLAHENGLATCPQEAWANHHRAVKEFLNIPEDEILFAGLSLGYEDKNAPVNKLKSDRAPFDEFLFIHHKNKL